MSLSQNVVNQNDRSNSPSRSPQRGTDSQTQFPLRQSITKLNSGRIPSKEASQESIVVKRPSIMKSM